MTDHASLFSLFSSLQLGLKLFICTFLLLQPSLSPWYCNADVSHTVAENFHWRQLWKRNMRDWKEDHEKDRNSGGRNRSLHIYILIVKFRSKALKYEHFNGTGWRWTLLLYAFMCTVVREKAGMATFDLWGLSTKKGCLQLHQLNSIAKLSCHQINAI